MVSTKAILWSVRAFAVLAALAAVGLGIWAWRSGARRVEAPPGTRGRGLPPEADLIAAVGNGPAGPAQIAVIAGLDSAEDPRHSPAAAGQDESFESFDPEQIFALDLADIAGWSDALRRENDEVASPSAPVDAGLARQLIARIRSALVPADEDERAAYHNVLVALEEWNSDGPENGERLPTRRARANFLRDLLGAGVSLDLDNEAVLKAELWAKVLEALGCDLSEEERGALGTAIDRVNRRLQALDSQFVVLVRRAWRHDEAEPERSRRFGLVNDLWWSELDRVWPEFQNAFVENLRAENLERVAQFFGALGVWAEE